VIKVWEDSYILSSNYTSESYWKESEITASSGFNYLLDFTFMGGILKGMLHVYLGILNAYGVSVIIGSVGF
jgi:hypothetical protein